jgi:hypothetical protein
VDALICFSTFLTLVGIDALADVDRPLLERYLAHVTAQPGGHGMKKTRIGGLNLFFQNIRQNGWDDMLPGTAAFYLGDTPPVPEQVDRRLAEYVMTQVEAPANLDHWPNPAVGWSPSSSPAAAYGSPAPWPSTSTVCSTTAKVPPTSATSTPR